MYGQCKHHDTTSGNDLRFKSATSYLALAVKRPWVVLGGPVLSSFCVNGLSQAFKDLFLGHWLRAMNMKLIKKCVWSILCVKEMTAPTLSLKRSTSLVASLLRILSSSFLSSSNCCCATRSSSWVRAYASIWSFKASYTVAIIYALLPNYALWDSNNGKW